MAQWKSAFLFWNVFSTYFSTRQKVKIIKLNLEFVYKMTSICHLLKCYVYKARKIYTFQNISCTWNGKGLVWTFTYDLSIGRSEYGTMKIGFFVLKRFFNLLFDTAEVASNFLSLFTKRGKFILSKYFMHLERKRSSLNIYEYFKYRSFRIWHKENRLFWFETFFQPTFWHGRRWNANLLQKF